MVRAMPLTASPALPIAAGLAGALLAALAARIASSGAPERPGWRHVRPGAMHWTGLVLGCGLVALMVYVRLFVGSTRGDAAFQMQVLSVLIAAFALGTAICAWQIRSILCAGLYWREDDLAQARPDGTLALRPLRSVVAVDRSWSGTVRIAFADGAPVVLDPMARNAEDLLARIGELRAD